MSDLLDVRAEQALDAARAKLAELEREEAAAIAAGDAQASADRRGERLLLEEATLMLEQRKADATRQRSRLPEPKPSDSGPEPMTTAVEIARKRQELRDAGQHHGERSIAAALGVSRDAVRYALGKDRRRK